MVGLSRDLVDMLDNVPWTLVRNNEYRVYLQNESRVNGLLQREMLLRARRDPVWFAAVMVRTRHGVGFWCEELGEKLSHRIPFLLYDKQAEFVRLVSGAFLDKEKEYRIAFRKSREQGATWMVGLLFLWLYLFYVDVQAAVTSANMNDLDKKKGSFFKQFDYMLGELRLDWPWLLAAQVPSRRSGEKASYSRVMYRMNYLTKTELFGAATGGNFIRGDRVALVVLDEAEGMDRKESGSVETALGSAAAAARVLVVMSTLSSGSSTFSELFTEEAREDGWIPFELHWTDSPHCRKGFYICEAGRCRHPDHGKGGFPHSEWYDERCRTLGWNPILIGSELDIRVSKSGSSVFDLELVDRVIKRLLVATRKPVRGTLSWVGVQPNHRNENENDWSSLDVEFREDDVGRFLIYSVPMVGRRYCLGGDPATGTGDNAIAYVLDVDAPGGPMAVAEYAAKNEAPEIADAMAMLARYYEVGSGMENQVPMAIERNHCGVAVVAMVRNYGGWVLRSKVKKKAFGKTMRDGIVVSSENKIPALTLLMQPLINTESEQDGLPILTVPFVDFWVECRSFERKVLPSGKVTMRASAKKKDDRVMAMLHALQCAERVYQTVRNLGLTKVEENEDLLGGDIDAA